MARGLDILNRYNEHTELDKNHQIIQTLVNRLVSLNGGNNI